MKKIAIVPGFSHTSLSTIRCLAKGDVEVWSVGPTSKKGPAYFSNIPKKKVVYENDNGLIECLRDLGARLAEKPALLLTEDAHVVEVARSYAMIRNHYRCLLPEFSIVDSLMDKAKFALLAIKNGYQIPKTKIINGQGELAQVVQEFSFPFLLKPYLLHSKKINSYDELREYLSTFKDVNYSSLIVQEWIPGPDDQLYFCFLFFDSDGKLVAKFIARKIRQFPRQYGTTSFCVSEEHQDLLNESMKIFTEIGYRGFCSIEYKYDALRKEYFIMEPTVGRFNQQVALTDASGVNFPLMMLNYLYGEASQRLSQLNGKCWIYETNDFFSTMQSEGFFEYVRSFKKADVKVLFSSSDPAPFFSEIYDILSKKMRTIFNIKNS